MDTPKLVLQIVTDPLKRQRITGFVTCRVWGQSLDETRPATWAIAIRAVSRDGESERGVLLPLTTGPVSEAFDFELSPRDIGPLELNTTDVDFGDRIVVTLESLGAALIPSRDDRESWFEFSETLVFLDQNRNRRNERSRKIGKCIYCGSVSGTLSSEHIVPAGLNGEWTLNAASCARCSDTTSRFERDVLRNMFGSARNALGMRTRRHKERPSQIPIVVRDQGIERQVKVPTSEYPAVLAFPVFPPPTHVSNTQASGGVRIIGIKPVRVSGMDFRELHRRYGGEYTGTRNDYQPMEFARALAKIAYGFAVLQFGIDRIEENFVLPAILGDTSGIRRWVGGYQTESVERVNGLHSIRTDVKNDEVHAQVQLFAQFGAPVYHVVVGRIRAEV